MAGEIDSAIRWRLMLGQASQAALGCNLEGAAAACESALNWLYERDAGVAQRGVRQAGQERSRMTVVDWIESVHRLFPQETIERLEREAVEKYQVDELVTHPAVLQRVKPSTSLLQAVMKTRHLMNEQVLALARELVRRVVEELMEKLAREVLRSFSGSRRWRRSSPFRHSQDLDFETTIRANLKHYDAERQRLVVEKPYFYPHSRRHRTPWQVILLVDQSGSMGESVIHSAVTAACLCGLPALKTHLVVFDTAVVDLSDEVSDPVETLMKVQLGGGTDICKAVEYGAGLVMSPQRTMLIVITDFMEGGDSHRLVQVVRDLVAQGTLVLGLASLNPEAQPEYDREMAQRWVQVGAHVGAMTPGELANWIAEKVQR